MLKKALHLNRRSSYWTLEVVAYGRRLSSRVDIDDAQDYTVLQDVIDVVLWTTWVAHSH